VTSPDNPAGPTAGANEGLPVRCGFVSFSGERTFWLHGGLQTDFEAAGDFITALMQRYPRLDIVVTAPQFETRQWLRRTYPRAIVLPPPLGHNFFANRVLVNLNVRGLMFLGDLAPGDRAILRAANRRAIPAVITQTSAPGAEPPSATALGAVAERFEHHFVTTPAARERLAGAGVPAARTTLLEGTPQARTQSCMTVVAQLLMQDLKLIRSKQRPIRRRLERLALWCMEQPRLRRALSRKVERIDDIAALRAALDRPQTILCLGNGPSSEDPAVAGVAYDRLFRVNHVWLDRGFLTAPDMVFTGSKATLATVKGAIFGLQSIKSEARLLVTRLLRPQLRRLRYATIERFDLYLSEPRWHGVRPTNGAAMLAVAVALQPPRLVIAGIDLFSHPAGTYPGDQNTPNAYSPGHEAESELALLMAALSLYQGDLVIMSPALQDRWDEFRRGQPHRQDSA
jgi:3-Deoxy-D-manno-octulosonic-acid transferase (kdotransferase)